MHHLVNESDEDVLFIEVGDRTPGESVSYPDDDLAVTEVDGEWRVIRKEGTPFE